MGQLFKNTASQKLRVYAYADAGHATLDAGEPVTGDAANITAVTAVDNGALGSSNDVNPAEVDATNAKGYYEFDPTQAETNGDVLEFYPSSSTAGVQVKTVGGDVQTLQPPNFPDMGIETDGHVHGDVKEWLGTAPAALTDTDKVQVSLQHSGSGLTGDIGDILTDTNSLNDTKIPDTISLANINAEADTALTDFFTSSAQLVDDIWDEATSGHTGAGSFGKALRQLFRGVIATDGEVNDVSATTSSFVTNLAETTDDHYNELVLAFVSGNLDGQAAIISDYDGGTKTVTLEETLTEAPADTDEFIILTPHTHSQANIAAAVWDETASDHTTNDTFGNEINIEHEITRDLIESQRDDHSRVGKGNVYYVDPVNGDTHANGNRGGRNDPYAGIQDCHDNAVTDWNHDVIILVAGDGTGQTSLDEQPTISKNYVFIRGPGQGFLLTTTSNGDLLTISGEGVEVSSLELSTNTAGSGAGVVVTGDFVQVRHVVISRTQGDGIQITGCEKALIENTRMFNTGQSGSGDGIAIDGTSASTRFTLIRDCEILDTQGDGINLTGGNTDDTLIRGNAIHGSTGWGVNIASGVTATVVTQNDFSNNSSGAVTDSGTNSEIEKNNDWVDRSEITLDGAGRVDVSLIEGTDATDQIRDAILDDATRFSGADIAAILTDTGTDGVVVNTFTTSGKAEIEAEAVDALQTTVDDSIPADGSRPSVQQAVYMIVQVLTEFAISGTTITVKKPDGTTTLMTLTLDDDTNPTSATRAT